MVLESPTPSRLKGTMGVTTLICMHRAEELSDLAEGVYIPAYCRHIHQIYQDTIIESKGKFRSLIRLNSVHAFS